MQCFKTTKISNEPDDLHCLQACLRMAHEALGLGSLSLQVAESVSGYQAGRETWMYKTLAWLAAQRLLIEHIEDFSPHAFIENSTAELARHGFDGNVIDYIQSITDLAQERLAIEACNRYGNLTFVLRQPDADDVVEALRNGWLPVVGVDAAILSRRPGTDYDGHVVLATGLSRSSRVILQDPGLPARWDWEVDQATLSRAMHAPTVRSGSLTLLRPVTP